jgi:hypothetical protein
LAVTDQPAWRVTAGDSAVTVTATASTPVTRVVIEVKVAIEADVMRL